MKIVGFIWIDYIVEKLHWKHQISQEEVRDIFDNRPKFRFVEKGHHSDENVYFAMGKTMAGRYLIVFFVYKIDKRSLILSAREMSDKERKQYERK